MMKIDNVSTMSNNMQSVSSSANVQYDAVGKSIESKIMDAQKRQQGLNSDREMTAEEKSSTRQEIQREISELKRQLRQHQAEQKKEQQKEDKSTEERKERLKNEVSEDTKGVLYEGKTSDAVKDKSQDDTPVSKESAMKQIRVVINADAKADGKIRVMEAEEKQDAIGKTGNVNKNSRLEDVKRRSQRVEIAQKAMFGDKNKKADKTVAPGKHFYEDDRYKGLYNDKGMMIADPIVSL